MGHRLEGLSGLGSSSITDYCQLDKDLLDVALHGVLGLAQRATGIPSCDSSECLFCSYASECKLHASSAAGKLCSLLRKRSLSSNGSTALDLASKSDPAVLEREAGGHAGGHSPRGSPARRQRTTERLGEPQHASSTANASSQSAQTHSLGSGQAWAFEDHFDAYEQPAPATLTEWNTWSLLPSQCGSHDMISALEFSPDGKLLISGSINKQLRLYSLTELFEGGSAGLHTAPSQQGVEDGSAAGTSSDLGVNSDDEENCHDEAPSDRQGVPATYNSEEAPDRECQSADELDYKPRRRWQRRGRSTDLPTRASSNGPGSGSLVAVHRLPSKISCVAWSHHLDGVVTVGDYDGVLTQLHVCSGHQLADIDAHAGRRIWGIAQSPLQANLCASVADDGSACLWAGPCLDQCIAILKPHGQSRPRLPGRPRPGANSLCGVDFSSTHAHLLALASADQNVYVYDIRATHQPLHVLSHHNRPVSYVKFFGSQQLVSASTDSTVAIWDLTSLTATTTSSAPRASSQLHSCRASSSPSLSGPPQSRMFSRVAGSCSDLTSLPFHAGQHTREESPDACMHDTSEEDGITARDGGMRRGVEPSSSGSLLTTTDQAMSAASQLPSSSRDSMSSEPLESRSSHTSQPWKVLRGHRNERNFVGLAVRPEDGLIAVGSETSSVFTYHRAWSSPLATYDFYAASSRWSARADWAHRPRDHAKAMDGSSASFVSAVAWQSVAAAREQGLAPLLAAGTSWGDVRLLTLNRP